MQVTMVATFTATDGEEVEEVTKSYEFEIEETGEVDITFTIVADFDEDEDTVEVRSSELKVE